MQEKGIISTNQYIWMLFIIITSLVSVQATGILIVQAGRDAWLSVIGGWFLDVLRDSTPFIQNQSQNE